MSIESGNDYGVRKQLPDLNIAIDSIHNLNNFPTNVTV